MLLTLMMNLNMFGQPIPPTPNDQSGDGFRLSESYKIVGEYRELKEKLLRRNNEYIIVILSHWMTKNK